MWGVLRYVPADTADTGEPTETWTVGPQSDGPEMGDCGLDRPAGPTLADAGSPV
jgi:hypothetical protein